YAKAREGLLGAYRLYEEDLSDACKSLRGQPGRVTVLPKTCAATGPTTTASEGNHKHPRSPERRIEEYKEMMDAVSLILTKIGCHGGSEDECLEKIETLSSAAAVDSGMVASQLASTMLYQAVADDGGGL